MKIICFSSHTATWYFALAEATIGSALQKKGHNVLYITPGNLFAETSNLAQEQILREEFNLKGYELCNILTKSDVKRINLIISRLTKDNFENLKIDGINIGKIAMYEFLLNHKKMNAKFTQTEWPACVIELKDTLTSFFACKAIIKKEKPDRILMYGDLYSVNHVWVRYASLKKIPVYFLHHGMNFSDMDNTLIIAKANSLDYFHRLANIWHKVKNVPVSHKILSYVTDNFFELLKAKHFLVYSSPKSKKYVDIRKLFDIKNNQRVLTATMSSYDELFTGQYVGVWNIPKHLVFNSQSEWIKALINYVKVKQNLFLIIRVHPREFPNKRERIRSEHSKILKKVLKDLPDNVRVNWPTDNISIYDLAQETDVFLNAWSSVGVEMSLLGIPVVIYSKELVLYPPDLNYVARNRKDYFDKIESALKDGWSHEKIKKTYRWLALYYFRPIMRIRSRGVKSKSPLITRLTSNISSYLYSLLSPKLRSLLIKIYFKIPGLGVSKRQIYDCRKQLAEKIDISRVEKMLSKSEDTLVNINEASKSHVTIKEEDHFIRNEVKKIYQALYSHLPKDTKNNLRSNLRNTFILHDGSD